MEKYVNKISEIFPEILYSFNDSKLYHYTNLNALYGIIENRELWFTNSGFLNDEDEISFGANIIKNKLFPILKEKFTNSSFSHLYFTIATFASYVFGTSLVYTFSLSKVCDDLSQWRGYANNGGVSLEFNNNFKFLNNSPYFINVIYDAEKQINILDFSLKYIVEEIENFFLSNRNNYDENDNKFLNPDIDEQFYHIAKRHGTILLFVSSILKKNIFLSEHEVRLIFFNHKENRIHFRGKNGILIPYIKLELQNLNNFANVYLSPLNKDPLVKKSIDFYVQYKFEKNSINSNLKVR